MSLISPRTGYWLKTLSKFVSVQLIVQAIGLASGILLVRTLDKQEYAYFTIANTMQATMSLLANMGVGISLSAIGGKVWQDRYRFGQLINTAMQLRYYLAAISITVISPILIWMLIRNGASLVYAMVITVVVLIGLAFRLTTEVLFTVPRLHSQIERIQNLELFSALSRLFLVGIGYLSFLNVALAVAIASIITGFQRIFLGNWAKENIILEAPINKEYRKFIFTNIKNVAPNSIFFCVQGQLNVFLISMFGDAQNVAEIGALGRLAVIFTVIQSVMNSIILPSFSRCQSIKLLQRRYVQILGLFLLFDFLLIGITYLFPSQIIWILGVKYAHLTSELTLIMCSTALTYFIGVIYSLNATKAWVEYVWIEIPLRIILQIILLFFLDISTIRGVLILNLLSNLSPLLVNFLLAYRGLTTYKIAN